MIRYIRQNQSTVICIGVLLLCGLCHNVTISNHLGIIIKNLITNVGYYGVAVYWRNSLKQRIVNPKVYRYFGWIPNLIIVLLLIRQIKYDYIHMIPSINNYFWYAYYIPLINIPTIAVITSQFIGKGDRYEIDLKWFLLFLPSLFFCLMTMTNNLHQLVFKLEVENFRIDSPPYHYNFLYYLMMIYFFGEIIYFLYCITSKNKVEGSKHKIYIPILIFLISAILLVLKILELQNFYMVPEIFCMGLGGMLEACIQIGLLPVNTNYVQFFEKTTLKAEMIDMEGRILYRTKTYEDTLVEDEVLREYPIDGGTSYYIEDMSRINELQRKLTDTANQLSEENNIIQANNDLNKKRVKLETENRLYEMIENRLYSTIQKVEERLDHADKEDFKELVLYNTYIKRYSNLMILHEENEMLSFFELENALNESLNYLKLSDKFTLLNSHISTKVSGHELIEFYSVFQRIIELSYPTLKGIMINTKEDREKITISMMVESDSCDFPIPSFYEDGAYYFTYLIEKGEQENV